MFWGQYAYIDTFEVCVVYFACTCTCSRPLLYALASTFETNICFGEYLALCPPNVYIRKRCPLSSVSDIFVTLLERPPSGAPFHAEPVLNGF